MSFLISLHLVTAIIWVGGMFFAHMILRPAAIDVLEPPQRLALWRGVFKRFFVWVWISLATLLVTGSWIIFEYYGGYSGLPIYLHLMNGIGLIMMLLFMILFFGPYPRLRQAVEIANWPQAAQYLNTIRLIVTINLVLGLLVCIIAAAGRYI